MPRTYWDEMASDLNIVIFHPYILVLDPSTTLQADAFFPSFGGENGMLVFHDSRTIDGLEKELVKSGFGFSCFCEMGGDDYQRSDAIEMLADWGWNAKLIPPPVWLPNDVP